MNLRLVIYIALMLIWMLPLSEANAEDSIINQYDTNGSLVSGDGKFYEYNDANQLVRVREKDAIGAVVAEYFYDHTGQRVKKVESGVTTYYLGKYYETQLVQGQAQNTSYYFAEGDRVAKKASTGIYYYHPDHLGGTSAVTNITGQMVSSTSYLPFGDVRQGGAEKYSYTGKEMDKATGLYNFDARYTSPELRHFTQADIADPDFDDPQDLNRYAYVGNNPTSFIDPDGHKKKKKTKKKKKSHVKYIDTNNKAHNKQTTDIKNIKEILQQTEIGSDIWDEIQDIGKKRAINIGFSNDTKIIGDDNQGYSFIKNGTLNIALSGKLKNNPIEAALTFIHEATHVIDGLKQNYSCRERINLEKSARNSESTFWNQLGNPKVGISKHFELEHPNATAATQTLLRDCW